MEKEKEKDIEKDVSKKNEIESKNPVDESQFDKNSEEKDKIKDEKKEEDSKFQKLKNYSKKFFPHPMIGLLYVSHTLSSISDNVWLFAMPLVTTLFFSCQKIF